MINVYIAFLVDDLIPLRRPSRDFNGPIFTRNDLVFYNLLCFFLYSFQFETFLSLCLFISVGSSCTPIQIQFVMLRFFFVSVSIHLSLTLALFYRVPSTTGFRVHIPKYMKKKTRSRRGWSIQILNISCSLRSKHKRGRWLEWCWRISFDGKPSHPTQHFFFVILSVLRIKSFACFMCCWKK